MAEVEITIRRKRPHLRSGGPNKGPLDIRHEADYLKRRTRTTHTYIWIDYDPATIGAVDSFTTNPVFYDIHRLNNLRHAVGFFDDGGATAPPGYLDNIAQIFKEDIHKAPAADFSSSGWDVNDADTVVGVTKGGGTDFLRAFQNDDPPFGSFHLLGHIADLSGDHFGKQNIAFGVNNHTPIIIVGASNQAVLGDAYPSGTASGQALRWDSLAATLIFGSDGGASSAAYDVNDSGVIVGIRTMAPFILHPSTGLVTLPVGEDGTGDLVLARAINSAGHVIGTHTPTAFNFWSKGWYWDGTHIHNIPNPTPSVTVDFGSGPVLIEASLEPWDINDSDQVVGGYVSTLDDMGNETKTGFLWSPSAGLVDLNTLLQPGTDFVITKGTGINNNGDIAATGYHTGIFEGAGRPFLGKKVS